MFFFMLGRFPKVGKASQRSFGGFPTLGKLLRVHLELSAGWDSLFLSVWRYPKVGKGSPLAFGGFPKWGNLDNKKILA